MNLELKDRYINKNPLKKNSKKSNHINEIYSNGIDDQTKKKSEIKHFTTI